MVVTRKQDQGSGGVDEGRSKAHAGRCQYQVA